MSPETQPKTLSAIFTNQVLPSLFHIEAPQFLKLLAQDGNKFLRFYWSEAAKKLPLEQRTDPFGLQYDIRQMLKHTIVILISLPHPQLPGDAFYAALIYRPYRVTPILRIADRTKLILLELQPTDQDPQATVLVEIDRKLNREVIAPGTQPKLETFFNACWDRVKAESQ
jgi:hypothetical protein